MRRSLPFALVGLFALSIQSGQVRPASNARVSLDLGSVTVWLGMSKDEAVKRFADAGYRFTDEVNGTSAVLNDKQGYFLAFRNSRLTWAEVSWFEGNSGEAEAIMGALGSLADKVSSPSCRVTHKPYSNPDTTMNRVSVSCGERAVVIAKGKFSGSPNVLFVTEQIGEPPLGDQ